MKFQYMNGLSYTHNKDLFIECSIRVYEVLPVYIYTLHFYCFIHLTYIQLFINSVFTFLLQELDLLEYIIIVYISHALSIPKTTFNKCTYELHVYSMPI